jgi:hydroxymethylglutaryl-CoA reductase
LARIFPKWDEIPVSCDERHKSVYGLPVVIVEQEMGSLGLPDPMAELGGTRAHAEIHQELAVILGKPNANAARVAVTRALARLMEQLDES